MQLATMTTAGKNLTDEEIAKGIVSGDQAAFVSMMRRYNQTLYRTARSILKNDAEAEDALQEAYLLAYRSIDTFRGDAKLSTWLTRIVANEAFARLRKSSRRAEIIPIDGELEWDRLAVEELMDDATPEPPEHAALRAETSRLIETKIDALPDAFRTVFVLRAIDDMAVDEVALCLGIPEATVRSRFFRARSLLREALSREIDFAIDEAFSFDGERCDRIVAGVLARKKDLQKRDA